MRRTLQIVAVGVGLTAGLLWLSAGAPRGWTKTSVAVKTVDEVTGIEGIAYESRFVPGLDFLAGALLAAGVLAGASLLLKRPKHTTHKMKSMNLKSVLLLALFGLVQGAEAAPLTFDFKDPKGVNNAVFKLDAPLEAINGSANGVSGTVTFDPQNPGATKGKIVIAASTLHVPNPMMKEHLHSAQWLDVSKHPEITFEAKELRNVKPAGDNKTSADAVGTMTIRGVSKELTVPVTLTYLPDKLGQRVPKMKGDLLVIRANFIVSRKDFGINPGAPEDKVAKDIDLTVSIAGAAPRQ